MSTRTRRSSAPLVTLLIATALHADATRADSPAPPRDLVNPSANGKFVFVSKVQSANRQDDPVIFQKSTRSFHSLAKRVNGRTVELSPPPASGMLCSSGFSSLTFSSNFFCHSLT